MTSEWREARLGDVLTLKRGYDLPKHSREPGDIPIVSSSGVSGSHSEAKVAGPGVVTGRYGTIGQVFYVDGHFWPLNTTLYVQDFKGNRPRYIKYLLETLDFHQFSDKAAVPGVNRNHLHEALVLVPPPSEQERIETVLAMLEWRIDNLRQTNATLEAIAQALFKSWFVDFDPVRAKAEGREPEGMDAATAALFPSEFEDSELGPIPKGWRATAFGSLLEHSIGGDWGSEHPTDQNTEKVAIIRGTDIPDLRFQLESRVPIRFTTKKKAAGRRLLADDLIIEVSGGSKGQPTGRSLYMTSGIIDSFDCQVVPASFCRKFSPLTPQIGILIAQHMNFIYAAGRTWEYQNQSTGISNFQTKYFLETEKVIVPCGDVLNTFFDVVQPMMDRAQLLQAKRLAELRDTLLPRLISGKLRLPEADSTLEKLSA